MSQSPAHYLLESRGVPQDLDAFVVGASFDRAGAMAAFALGDGTLRLVTLTNPDTWRTIEALPGSA